MTRFAVDGEMTSAATPGLFDAAPADRRWMARALALARRAGDEGEVPVGAVLVRGEEILGGGWNRPIALRDPTAHAEVLALREGARRTGNYRLPGTTLYVTLEPCPMCAGAIWQARVERIVYGAPDPRSGALGSAFDLFGAPLSGPGLNHLPRVEGGVMGETAAELLRAFFRARRDGRGEGRDGVSEAR